MGILYEATVGGFERLAKSFAKNPSSESKAVTALGREMGVMGVSAAALLSPLLVPINLLAHGGAIAVKSYRGAWSKAPGITAMATAAVAVPVALSAMREKQHGETPAQALDQVGAAQAETDMVQRQLSAMDAPGTFTSMQQASPQIDAATAAAAGRVQGSPAAGYSVAG